LDSTKTVHELDSELRRPERPSLPRRNTAGIRLVLLLLKRQSGMRVLALDHGTKRIGVAVSDDEDDRHAAEYSTEPFAGFLARLKEIIREKEVDLIIIGMPRNMDGSYGLRRSRQNSWRC
jgi:hypothetical protein